MSSAVSGELLFSVQEGDRTGGIEGMRPDGKWTSPNELTGGDPLVVSIFAYVLDLDRLVLEHRLGGDLNLQF